ncbi:MAG TPA: ribulose-phosphate 3-epimerase [Spirochaetaceae bacterium]|nr:ribulose-phosphate 3-epimerase [Spirochaetaceae bacterium]
MEKRATLSVSVLGSDLTIMDRHIRMLEESGCRMIHLDVMDGHFVPNLTFGPDFIRNVKESTKMIVDTHLMITEPEKSLDGYIRTGSDYITVHAEAATHLHYCVKRIKDAGLKAGVALNPATSISVLDEILPYVDLVLIMSVNPGFSGQEFIRTSVSKIARLSEERKKRNLGFDISVDGGAGLSNASDLKKAGANLIVSASAFFKSPDKKAFIREIEQ